MVLLLLQLSPCCCHHQWFCPNFCCFFSYNSICSFCVTFHLSVSFSLDLMMMMLTGWVIHWIKDNCISVHLNCVSFVQRTEETENSHILCDSHNFCVISLVVSLIHCLFLRATLSVYLAVCLCYRRPNNEKKTLNFSFICDSNESGFHFIIAFLKLPHLLQ